MILVDSSAWIEFLRATQSAVHLRLRAAIVDGEVATTDVVVLELLAGSRPEQVGLHTRLVESVEYLPQHPRDDVSVAAEMYRGCRSRGVTIRSLNDCVIAAVAIRNEVPVLHADRDFDRLARHTSLEVLGG